MCSFVVSKHERAIFDRNDPMPSQNAMVFKSNMSMKNLTQQANALEVCVIFA